MTEIEKSHFKLGGGNAYITFWAAMVFGTLTHLFALVTPLHNYDDIASMPGGYGSGIPLGRWFLDVLGRIAETLGLNYNLPTLNAFAFLFLIAVSAAIVVACFGVKNKVFAAMVGMLFAAFPTVTSTLFFRYTAPFYGVSLVLAVLSPYVLRRYRFGFLLSVLCATLSMGIYQAYIPLTIGIFVLLLIQQSLTGETTVPELIRSGLYDCAVLALAAGAYLLCQNAAVAIFDVEMTTYRGVATMGQIELAEVPGLVWEAFRIFCNLPFQDFCGLAVRKIQKLTYLLLGGMTFVMLAVIFLKKIRKPLMIVAACVLCLLFPIAVNFIVVMCPGTTIYTLMVYGFALVGCAPMVIYEQLPSMVGALQKWKPLFTKLLVGGLAFLIFGYVYYNNTNYMALYYGNRQAENYVNSITVQVRMTEGFTPDQEWALLGKIEDPLLNCAWEEETTYGGNGFTEYLLNNYSRNEWFKHYIGYDIPEVSEERAAELHQSDAVKAMPCWPAEGSIQIVEDTVVIKFQEFEE